MRQDTFKGKYYCTSFCNFAHRLKDGMPVNHECYVLNPAGLRAEMAGDYTFQPFRIDRLSRGIRVQFVDEADQTYEQARAGKAQWVADVQAIATACARFNPTFDRARFLAACGVKEN